MKCIILVIAILGAVAAASPGRDQRIVGGSNAAPSNAANAVVGVKVEDLLGLLGSSINCTGVMISSNWVIYFFVKENPFTFYIYHFIGLHSCALYIRNSRNTVTRGTDGSCWRCNSEQPRHYVPSTAT